MTPRVLALADDPLPSTDDVEGPVKLRDSPTEPIAV